ncbi:MULTISPECIES: ATP-binding protein [unclassified Kribbella]|uniref:ATP-binding protein n=1 Tax=unclassified Kribbella TaxID=2644121 RepID=UPI00301783DE
MSWEVFEEGGEVLSQKFNPLEAADPQVISGAIKQRVRNIIKSYNHPADILAEPVQNAVDEIDEAVREKAIERGRVTVQIDCANGKVSVADNGRGISKASIRTLLAPDVTEKAELFRKGRSRGHKGVGLTFLAYGFNFFEAECRTVDEHYRVRMENARQWLEDSAQTDFPVAEIFDLKDEEGLLRAPGTVVTVQVGEQTEPKSLYRTFSSPEYAGSVLEAQTAIGLYPRSAAPGAPVFDAQLDYRTPDGILVSKELRAAFRFPHEKLKSGVKVFDVGKYLANTPPTKPPAKWTRKHQAAYRFYNTDLLVELLKGKADRIQGDLITNDAEVEAQLRKHSVTAYALAGFSAAFKDTLSESWSIPKNRKLIAPSIRVATDSMISSWQRDLSLSHRGFNVERIWVVVHLERVEPDLGRKDYPPEILELLAVLENPVSEDIAKQGDVFLLPTTRSGRTIDYDEPLHRAAERRKKPFPVQLAKASGEIRYLTEPTEEQDVVALFNELRGIGILAHFSPVFFSGSYAYDSYLVYDAKAVADVVRDAFPVDDSQIPKRQREGIAEFKFDPFELLHDLVRDLKDWKDIRWLICWDVVGQSRSLGGLTMHVVEADEDESQYAGVTHIASLDSAGEDTIAVIAVRTLIERLK